MWTIVKMLLLNIGEVLLSTVFSFVAAGAKRIAEQGGDLLVDSVREAVVAQENTEGDGLTKLKAAKEAAEDKLQAEGLEVAESTLNFAIEAAVAELKEGMAEIALREEMNKAE